MTARPYPLLHAHYQPLVQGKHVLPYGHCDLLARACRASVDDWQHVAASLYVVVHR